MSEVTDLDALVPAKAYIKFNDQEIEIKPPSTEEVLKLGFLGNKLDNSQDPDEAVATAREITDIVEQCIPELKGAKMATIQLLKIVALLNDMSVPPDSKELKKRGITPSDPKAP